MNIAKTFRITLADGQIVDAKGVVKVFEYPPSDSVIELSEDKKVKHIKVESDPVAPVIVGDEVVANG